MNQFQYQKDWVKNFLLTKQQKKQLWKALNAGGEILERKHIVELVSEIDQPDVEFISLLIDSLKIYFDNKRYLSILDW